MNNTNKIVLITGNQGKLNEFIKALGDRIESQKIDLVEIQGTAQEIVTAKLKKAFKKVNPPGTPKDQIKPVMVDDTSLYLDAHGKKSSWTIY